VWREREIERDLLPGRGCRSHVCFRGERALARDRQRERERERDQNCVPTAKVHSAGHTVLLSQRALKPLPSMRGKGEREGGSGRRRRRGGGSVCAFMCLSSSMY